MLFARTLRFATTEPRQVVAARLTAAVLSARTAFSFKPVPIAEWMAQRSGKTFVGTVGADHFKLGVIGAPGRRFRSRGSVVVIVGTIEDHSVQAILRPPVFISAFMAAFALAVSAVFALSFFGPGNTPAVHWSLAFMLIMPMTVVVWIFRQEARDAEQALRKAVGIAAP
jgi:hypothetical protein